jgi:hypothetical protein
MRVAADGSRSNGSRVPGKRFNTQARLAQVGTFPARSRHRAAGPIIGWTAAALLFAAVATLNCGAYRYGVGDQAFYIPAILRHLNPDFFPRDRILIDDQDRLTVTNRAIALLVGTTGMSTPAVFAAMYLASVGLAFAGAMLVATSFRLTRWAQVALAAALTLRHRVGMTAVNTLEGYGHPRMLAWGIGLVAVGSLLRGRHALALALAAVAVVVHPTTGMWFGIWIGVAVAVSDRRMRPWLLGAGVVGLAGTAWILAAGPLAAQVVRMDPEWLSVLSGKGYLFPTEWPLSMWAVTALYGAVVPAVYALRCRLGVLVAGETGLFAGAMALLAVFLVTLPFVHAHVAVAVQFQVSRIFWMFDFVAVLYAVWLAVDLGSRPAATASSAWMGRAAVALVVVCAALGRGAYVSVIEHPGQPVVRIGPGTGEWEDACAWIARTKIDSHVLADPGHSYRYGTSARVSGERDTYLEDVKDSAMAMYSRRVAMRVLERTRALGNFPDLTPSSARALAARFDIDYLVTERAMDLPAAYRNARFWIYRLKAE